jgi:hypothetical protein
MKRGILTGLVAIVLTTGCATGKTKLEVGGYTFSTGNSIKVEKIKYRECEQNRYGECFAKPFLGVSYEF